MASHGTELLRFFAFHHLPSHLQKVSEPFHALANHIATTLPNGPERTVALRKLLESKDAAVRAALPVEDANVGMTRRETL